MEKEKKLIFLCFQVEEMVQSFQRKYQQKKSAKNKKKKMFKFTELTLSQRDITFLPIFLSNTQVKHLTFAKVNLPDDFKGFENIFTECSHLKIVVRIFFFFQSFQFN